MTSAKCLAAVVRHHHHHHHRCFTTISAAAAKNLQNIKVLDLSSILAGPFCTLFLADSGADVIKVEKVQGGDDTRQWGPPFMSPDRSGYFLCTNRNKRSIGIDLKTEHGARLCRRLATEWADVLVENFLPGKLEKYGLDYGTVSATNPRIVYASLTGYGQDGPDAQRPGYDVMIAARGGLMGVTGTEEEPVKVGVAMTDLATGLYLSSAIISALYQRHYTNRGQHVTTALLACQVALLANIGQNYLLTRKQPSRRGTQHESIIPYQRFKSADGDLVLGALNDGQWRRLLDTMAHVLPSAAAVAELRSAEYATNPLRVQHREHVIGVLSECFAQASTRTWLAALDQYQVPCAPVNTFAGVFENDEQIKHLGMVVKNDDYATMAHPVEYDGRRPDIERSPPRLGEHTREVLSELLFLENKEIDDLIARRVIVAHQDETVK